MTYSANYPCIIQITSFDNEGKCVGKRKGFLVNYSKNHIDVVDSWGTEFTLLLNQLGPGWISTIDDTDTVLEVLPDPNSTPFEYSAVEAILSQGDYTNEWSA